MFRETVKVKSLDDHKNEIIKHFNDHGVKVDTSHIAYIKPKAGVNVIHHTFVVVHQPQNGRVLSDKYHQKVLGKINKEAEQNKNMVHMYARDVSHENEYQKKYPGNRISIVHTPNTIHGRRSFNQIQ
jgi:hypothetical protein